MSAESRDGKLTNGGMLVTDALSAALNSGAKTMPPPVAGEDVGDRGGEDGGEGGSDGGDSGGAMEAKAIAAPARWCRASASSHFRE